MTDSYLLLSQHLRRAGYSTTAPRKHVFDALLHQEPMQMSALIQKLAGNVDRASVYRTIDLFEALNIVQRLTIGWKYKIELSDSFHEHHHHMSCNKCGVLISIDGDSHIEQDIADIAYKHGFALSSHQLEIQGICNNCQ